MEVVLLIGIQASGKSTFYKQRFFDTHVRINLDMLKTRNREKQLMQVCLQTQQPFVIDNTNPTKEDRQKYIEAVKSVNFRVIGYYFQSQVENCKNRNERRSLGQQVPLAGILGTYNRLEIPTFDEGFDELYYVKIGVENTFTVEKWSDEI